MDDHSLSIAFLINQGVLDEQFLELQQLQDESSPDFVSEVVTLYFHESDKSLTILRRLMTENEKVLDKKKVGGPLYGLLGSSASIGAKKVREMCVAFRAANDQNNREECLLALELLEHEYGYLKNKLHKLFQI